MKGETNCENPCEGVEMHIFILLVHSEFISSYFTKQTPSSMSLPIVWVQSSMNTVFCIAAFSLSVSFFHPSVLFLWTLNVHFGWSWQNSKLECQCQWLLPLSMQYFMGPAIQTVRYLGFKIKGPILPAYSNYRNMPCVFHTFSFFYTYMHNCLFAHLSQPRNFREKDPLS